MDPLAQPTIAGREEWLRARLELLQAEKELTRRRDELSRQRRALPWVRIDKSYEFDTVDGPRSLPHLFDGRSQLLVYHFMFGPDWEEGCPSCSFWADNFDGIGVHLAHRDATLLAVSRAPLERLVAYRDRMGWTFPWVSSLRSDFNMDFGVSEAATYNYVPVDHPEEELPGLSVFAQRDGDVFHTYSCYARGIDTFNGAYQLLDLTPKGRDEDDLESTMAWLHRHDAYPDTRLPSEVSEGVSL
jgi:predicted dithiol-disulfide oxidoreductase (DUF899 family)